MTDRQTRLRRIAVAAEFKNRFADVETAEKTALLGEMSRGNEAVVDDQGNEIGLVTIPKASPESESWEIDESVVIPWRIEEEDGCDVIEEIVRLKDWARRDVIERAKKAHAEGEELPAGVARVVRPGRVASARYVPAKSDAAKGIPSAGELIDGMVSRGVLTLTEVLMVEEAK